MLVYILHSIILPFGYLFFPALPFATVYFALEFWGNRRRTRLTAKLWGLLTVAALVLLIMGLTYFAQQTAV